LDLIDPQPLLAALRNERSSTLVMIEKREVDVGCVSLHMRFRCFICLGRLDALLVTGFIVSARSRPK
jgi:hypothetical protein